jgi:hypothetical protein
MYLLIQSLSLSLLRDTIPNTVVDLLQMMLLTKFHEGVYTSGIKMFNHLPHLLNILANDEKSFKSTLKKFLNHHSFYSVHEYYQYMEDEGVW